MKISNKDKDKLIILGVFIAVIAIVAISYMSTRYLPLRWIGIICLLFEFGLVIPYITKKYLTIYGYKPDAKTYVPLLNCIITFPKVPAIMMIICVVIAAICGITTVIPTTVLANVLGDAVVDYPTYVMNVLHVMYYAFFIVMGCGYCSILHDVRRMAKESSRAKTPVLELVYYPLQFLPIINIIGLIGITRYLGRLVMRNYGEVTDQAEDLVEET